MQVCRDCRSRTRRVEWTGDYLADERFGHTVERDAFVREVGILSVIAAPMIHRDVVVGAITVYGDRRDAFDADDAALLLALADQAAVAIANAGLIVELERSHDEIARRADAERTLREIAARVSAILDPAEVLQQIVEETTRLLESDGARIDLYDPELDALRWSYAAGEAMAVVPEWATTTGLKAGEAVAGTAYAEQRPMRTDDYLVDERFHGDNPARDVRDQRGLRSVIAVPLAGDTGRARDAVGGVAQGRRLRRRRRRGADRVRDPGVDRHPERPAHGGDRSFPRRHRPPRRGRAGAS